MSIAAAYNEVAYPSAVFRLCHPDRMAMIARLHGIAAPAVESCRMLEIGGGDGLNAIAVAAAYPGAECVNFDVAAIPVERGRRWADAAGLGNVRQYVLDIMDAADRLEGNFDYIVAHGVYAWVPEPVRAAVLALIERRLSPTGVAYVSYNALPGGYSRMAVRDLMRHHSAHLADPAARLAAARAALKSFLARPAGQEEPIVEAMRKEAEAALAKPDGFLFHDELGEIYAPQSLLAVAAAARGHGLAYLGEAGRGGLDLGFVDPARAGMSEDEWLHALQGLDYARGRYFRSSLFVRRELAVSRVIDGAAARDLRASTQAAPLGGGRFRLGPSEITIGDPQVARTIERLADERPAYAPVAELADDPQALLGLVQRAVEGFVDLHTTPAPFVVAPGERPRASALARMQAADGQASVVTLDHRMIPLDDPASRELLVALDGSLDRGTAERRWGRAALERLGRLALLAA